MSACHGLGRRGQVWAREPELNAGCQCGVKVEVVLGSGGDGLVDLREHALRERAVDDDAVEMHVQAEVTAGSLDHREHACVQVLHGGEAAISRYPYVAVGLGCNC